MQSEVKLAGWKSGELMGNFSSKLPWGNTVSLQEIWVKINHNCMQAHTHRDRRTAYMIWLWVFWHTNNDNTQKHQEHNHVFSLNLRPVCVTIRFLPIVTDAWSWCLAPLLPGWAVSGAKFSAGGQEPAWPCGSLCPLPWYGALAGNPQQKQLRQHSWRAASVKMHRVQELKEWKTCTDIAWKYASIILREKSLWIVES